ncbi:MULTISPECIES: tetratricopeptide repeat-containing sulfotransferase family protein [unclassified Mameliella]|uniref:tetratricopeptide repeat-containing sulfotransferase family protein n=1 Tax=unclassified Mameliella TaxID=2630630 RepID=UPI00273FF749|nr:MULTISPECIES: tetratricopeptide repeat-containing sulfotransferase family protein [unclassified Mameliella]
MTATTAPTDAAALEAVNEEIARITRHQNAGRFNEAGEALERLLEQYPGHPRLTHLKGLNLARSGDAEAGMKLLEDVVAHQPDDAAVLVDLGTLLAQSGRMEEARAHFETAAEAAPNYALAHANLGAALVMAQEYARAIPRLERAIALDGSVLDLHLNLAQAHVRTGNFQQSVDALFRALSVDPQSVAVHVNLAHALYRRERHEAAEHHARRAIELAPKAGEAWLHLGNILAAAGRMDEAADALLTAARMPGMALSALARLVTLRKTRADSPEWQGLQQLANRVDTLPDEAGATLEFALGKGCDDLGDHDRAFGHYAEANRLSRKLYPYDRQANTERAERMRALVTPALLQRHETAGLAGVEPIFVCGMPRSGTTLMEQMLSRHPEVQAGGELPAALRAFHASPRMRAVMEERAPDDSLQDDDFTKLGEEYQAFLHREGLRSARVTDKMPGNQLYIGLLALALPKANFLVMRRHPLDCLLSNWVQNFGRNQPGSTDLADLAEAYRQFDLNTKHWTTLLPDRVREVPYEALVADPEGMARDVLGFLGLNWSPDVLDHTASSRQVNTASVAQVREPVYGTSVARWRRYGAHLRPLAEALGDILTEEERIACGL